MVVLYVLSIKKLYYYEQFTLYYSNGIYIKSMTKSHEMCEYGLSTSFCTRTNCGIRTQQPNEAEKKINDMLTVK